MLCDEASTNSRTFTLLIDSTNASNVSHCLSATAQNLLFENYEKKRNIAAQNTMFIGRNRNKTRAKHGETETRFKLRCINSEKKHSFMDRKLRATSNKIENFSVCDK